MWVFLLYLCLSYTLLQDSSDNTVAMDMDTDVRVLDSCPPFFKYLTSTRLLATQVCYPHQTLYYLYSLSSSQMLTFNGTYLCRWSFYSTHWKFLMLSNWTTKVFEIVIFNSTHLTLDPGNTVREVKEPSRSCAAEFSAGETVFVCGSRSHACRRTLGT